MTPLDLPPDFVRAVESRPADRLLAASAPALAVDGPTFLRRLPGIVESRCDAWDLRIDGDPMCGTSAIVIPVRRGRDEAVLKVSWPHDEARFEHLALRAWQGRGAVRLLAAEPSQFALLLERCEPAEEFEQLSALDACEAIGELHHRLRRPALPQLPTASQWCARVTERLADAPPVLPRRFVDQARALARDLPRDVGVDAALVNTDLHPGNVMVRKEVGNSAGLVAIDPKPMAGEPAIAVAPLLWNMWDEAAGAYNLRNHLRFRVDYACEPMGIDPERARLWSILRVVDNALNDADQTIRSSQGSDAIGQATVIIKAMQG